jgi:diadenosine tetraphosphate (Ap4A) HIT family hydrolase
MDIGPVHDGHVLGIPKEHYLYLADVPEEMGRHLFAVAFQAVFHCHLHVFPRFEGDAFTIDADWSYLATREALDAATAAIRVAL